VDDHQRADDARADDDEVALQIGGRTAPAMAKSTTATTGGSRSATEKATLAAHGTEPGAHERHADVVRRVEDHRADQPAGDTGHEHRHAIAHAEHRSSPRRRRGTNPTIASDVRNIFRPKKQTTMPPSSSRAAAGI
jgi:hypothetical protein